MFKFLFPQNVDTIVNTFAKTVLDLKNLAEDMKGKIKAEQDKIHEAAAKQREYATEGVRAESIAKKLEGIIT